MSKLFWHSLFKLRFLYGGPGLWRSAGLKGSDPVLLLQQQSDQLLQTGGDDLTGGANAAIGIGRRMTGHQRRQSQHRRNSTKNADSRGQLRSGSLSGTCIDSSHELTYHYWTIHSLFIRLLNFNKNKQKDPWWDDWDFNSSIGPLIYKSSMSAAFGATASQSRLLLQVPSRPLSAATCATDHEHQQQQQQQEHTTTAAPTASAVAVVVNKSSNKLLPGRSVSFRESDMQNYNQDTQHGSSGRCSGRSSAVYSAGGGGKVLRTRPGSLKCNTRTAPTLASSDCGSGVGSQRRSFRIPPPSSIRETHFIERINAIAASGSTAAPLDGGSSAIHSVPTVPSSSSSSSSSSCTAVVSGTAVAASCSAGGGGSTTTMAALPLTPLASSRPIIIHRIPIHQAQSTHSKCNDLIFSIFLNRSIIDSPSIVKLIILNEIQIKKCNPMAIS